MNMKAVIPLVLAVVLGLVAAILVRNAIQHRNQAPAQASNLVTVVVAKQPADPGHQLTKEDVAVSKVPADAAPGQVFSDPNQLVGRVVTTPLVKGQAILETLLAPTGTGSGLQALVPPGMRAITLEVTEYSGVGGMLSPGCHIDVICMLHDEKTMLSFARTVLQNIKVQAVGHNVTNAPPADGQAPPAASNAITLLCTPKQAQIMQLAMATGRPWFVLRSARDGQELPLEGTTIAELRGGSEENNNSVAANVQPGIQVPVQNVVDNVPTDQPPAVTKRVVQVLRAGTESQVTFIVPNPRGVVTDVNIGDTH